MKRLATAILTLALMTATWPVMASAASDGGTSPEAPPPVLFGMESSAIGRQTNAGVAPDVGSFWIGPWTLKHGWGGPDSQLRTMRDADVTPAIHFYYWGDDISPDCVENGCWSDLHDAQKTKAGWNRLADEMVAHLNTEMEGEEVIIFVESEFNKGGIQTYEPFDGYMADMMDRIHEGYPNARLVLGFGSWGTHNYHHFDRAAEAADLIGIQGLRGSTRDSFSYYNNLYEDTLQNAKFVNDMFGKPVFIVDYGLSSYPEPDYLQLQADELQQTFDNMDKLQQVGVMALVYRSWNDSPNMDLKNYYGQAERHWGLSWSGTSELKPAGDVWVAGVKAHRGQAPQVAEPEPEPASGDFTASFEPSKNNNEWWVDVKVTGDGIAKVQASHDGGAYQRLDPTDWGTYAKSFHAPAGGEMTYRATDTSGRTAQATFTWPGGQPVQAAQPEPEPEPEPEPSGYTATFTPSKNVNEWWVEVDATSGDGIGKVEASHDGKAFITLPKQNWGAYAKSFHAPYGGEMTYRATSPDGQTHEATFTWPGGQPVAATEPEPEPEPEPANSAPVADLQVVMDGMQVHVDASASSDPDGDQLAYVIDFGDGAEATKAKASHTYAEEGTYTVSLTVSDGQAQDSAQQSVEAIRPNSAPVADLQVVVDGLQVSVDASASSDPDGDQLAYTIDFGDGAEASTAQAGHTYAADGTYTVTVTASDGKAADQASQTVQVEAPQEPFAADFQVSPNVNEWWVEVDVTGNADVAKVQVAVDGGSKTTLPKTSWGSYAKSIHVPAGSEVVFTATDADGRKDSSAPMTWLAGQGGSEEPAEPAFEADFTVKHQNNRWWVEVDVDASEPLKKVRMRMDGGSWMTMDQTDWGTYAESLHVKRGTEVQFRAVSQDGDRVDSDVFVWG